VLPRVFARALSIPNVLDGFYGSDMICYGNIWVPGCSRWFLGFIMLMLSAVRGSQGLARVF